MSSEAALQAEVDALHGRLAELRDELRRARAGGRDALAPLEVLLVRVESLSAAIELSAVREVVPTAALSPLPEAPPWVLGTLDLRGVTLPVIHAGARLLGVSPVLRVADRIAIVESELGLAGLIVDEVLGVRVVELDATTSLLEAPHAPYVVGTFELEERSRLLLGVREMLRHADLGPLLASERPPGGG